MATLTVQGVTDALQSVCGSPAAQGSEGAPQFRKELNLALPRLYNMGMWRDLLFEHVVTTSDGTFTIPDNAESVIAALLDPTGDSVDYSSPQEIRAQFHDYNIVGRDDRNGENTLAAFGIVDDGYSPTIENISPLEDSENISGYYIAAFPTFPDTNLPTNVANGRKVIVEYAVKAGVKTGTFSMDGTASQFFTDLDTVNVHSIKTGRNDLGADVKIVAITLFSAGHDNSVTLNGTIIQQGATGVPSNTVQVPLTDTSNIEVGDYLSFASWDASNSFGDGGVEIDTVGNFYEVSGVVKSTNTVHIIRNVADVEQWTASVGSTIKHHPAVQLGNVRAPNKVCRYRRYRVDHANRKVKLRLLLKRKFVELLDPEDLIHVSSISAIKHAMLGNIAEENADLERANYHWGVCRGVLAEPLDAHRGAAKPAIRFDPSGVGAFTSNMM